MVSLEVVAAFIPGLGGLVHKEKCDEPMVLLLELMQ